jgi:glycosyltransferase involved in cell wall biosynthesis
LRPSLGWKLPTNANLRLLDRIKPMRIAHFVQRYPPALGGSEVFFARLSRHLVQAGHQVSVFTTVADELEAFWCKRGRVLPAGVGTEDGVRIVRYPLWRWPGRRYVLKALSLLPVPSWQCLTLPCNPIAIQMWQDAGRVREPYDLVHATAFPYAWPIACARRLARRLQVPLAITPFLHTGDPTDARDRNRRAYTRPALMSLLHEAQVVFVQTQCEKQVLLKLGLPAERLFLVGMGVDPEECSGGDRRRARQEWRIAEQDVVIGHLANLSWEKGTVDLLQAGEQLWRRGFKATMVLAGAAMSNFHRFWKSFPARGPVRCLGVLNESQKRDFYAGIDIFALPSRSDSFGLVLLEAWANRLANVAYRAGGIAEVIQHQRDGLLAPCGDVSSLADALAVLIRDTSARARLGLAGYQRIPGEFSWPDKLKLVQQTYEKMTRGSRSSDLEPLARAPAASSPIT